jgi:hypothetical protein
MTERRMISNKVIDTDMFLEMPQSAQNLYFHMLLRADDDGFLGAPKRILRLLGCNEDDLKIIVAKQFVIPFESGVCVIKHWRMHNSIRKDRYRPTFYKAEKALLSTDENGTYIKHKAGAPQAIKLAVNLPKNESKLTVNEGKEELKAVNEENGNKTIESVSPIINKENEFFFKKLAKIKDYVIDEKMDASLFEYFNANFNKNEIVEILEKFSFLPSKGSDSENKRSRLFGLAKKFAQEKKEQEEKKNAGFRKTEEYEKAGEQQKQNSKSIETKEDAVKFLQMQPDWLRGKTSYQRELMQKFNISEICGDLEVQNVL